MVRLVTFMVAITTMILGIRAQGANPVELLLAVLTSPLFHAPDNFPVHFLSDVHDFFEIALHTSPSPATPTSSSNNVEQTPTPVDLPKLLRDLLTTHREDIRAVIDSYGSVVDQEVSFSESASFSNANFISDRESASQSLL